MQLEFSAPLPRPRLAVGLPSSLLEDCPTLREKTVKLGLIGRACAVFRVDEVVVFKDSRSGALDDSPLIKLILDYMEAPQYLRRRLFRLRPELRFAGLLPPLRTPHHPLESRLGALRSETLREGVVVRRRGAYCLVDVGLDKLVQVRAEGELRPGSRVTVLVDPVCGRHRVASPEEFGVYWGYRVVVLSEGLRGVRAASQADFVVGTSRRGRLVSDPSVLKELMGGLSRAERVLVLFGSPRAGLFEIGEAEGIDLREACDVVVNFIPDQGTRTVRTEEAVFSVLAIINFLAHLASSKTLLRSN